MDKPEPAPISPSVKLGLELGPLVVLVAITMRAGLVKAALPFAIASVLSTAILYRLQRKVNWILVVSTIAVAGFAALTWWFDDSSFLKLKVTIVSACMGLWLLVARALGKQPLRTLFESAMQLDEPGWSKFTLRFGLFFLAMAATNEVVRRVVDDEGYAIAKLALFFPLPIVFMATQLPLIKRHSLPAPEQGSRE